MYRILLILFFLMVAFIGNALGQNCGCCHDDDCPCRIECDHKIKKKIEEKPKPQGTVSKTNRKMITQIVSDISGVISMQGRSFSIKAGKNKINPINISRDIPYEFHSINGIDYEGTYPFSKVNSQTLYIQLSEQFAKREKKRNQQLLLKNISNHFISLTNGKPIEVCRIEVPVIWFAAFIKATHYKTSAEEKGKSIVRVKKGKHDEIKLGVNWQHNPLGLLQHNTEHPVIHVSWQDAKSFCDWLSTLDEKYNYRLPTYEEWQITLGFNLNHINYQKESIINAKSANIADASLLEILAYKKNIQQGYSDDFSLTAPVGSLAKNIYGFHHLLGNVAEWLEDNPLPHTPAKDKLYIGGSYFSNIEECSSPQFTSRHTSSPGIGFRLVRLSKL